MWIEQAVGGVPYGLSPKSQVYSYQAGCAIGRFLTPELAARLDGIIESVLTWESGYDAACTEARAQLLDRPDVPELGMKDSDIMGLRAIQDAHDNCAKKSGKAQYRDGL